MSSLKRIGDIEARWSKSLGKEPAGYVEIVKWERPKDPYCFTLCYWKKDSEGWDMIGVGARMFEYDDSHKLFALCRYVQKIADADFELECRTKG